MKDKTIFKRLEQNDGYLVMPLAAIAIQWLHKSASGFPSILLVKDLCECVFSILLEDTSDKAQNSPREIISENQVFM